MIFPHPALKNVSAHITTKMPKNIKQNKLKIISKIKINQKLTNLSIFLKTTKRPINANIIIIHIHQIIIKYTPY